LKFGAEEVEIFVVRRSEKGAELFLTEGDESGQAEVLCDFCD
jgi:hypothetical protein